MGNDPYLMAGQPTELQRLQLQSRVWEPAGRELLAGIPRRRRALDAGCGVMGWLRILSEWVAEGGEVVGTDIDETMLAHARGLVESERMANVTLVRDNLFASALPDAAFDLVHARFQLAPLGRVDEQLSFFRRVVKPGGWIVLEEPDLASWQVHPEAPAVRKLIGLIEEGFHEAGGNFNAGRELPALLRHAGREPRLQARIVALPEGHPYLRLPLQFAASLRPRLEAIAGSAELEELVRRAGEELDQPGRWGTTFTLIQAWIEVD